ncbi:hypothetical protein [Virgibacillus pantothenticus]|uniref:hypothetical protein n=1 Tax=Virgibacillus pantothenticus TaxID=1473 RepID=UPI00098610FC|nr:hypothetical protein [Virgibacillus pantothenticus]
MEENVYDVCIIGSGAGGSAACKKLAEKDWSVIIIGQGDNIPPGISLDSIMSMWEKAGVTSIAYTFSH